MLFRQVSTKRGLRQPSKETLYPLLRAKTLSVWLPLQHWKINSAVELRRRCTADVDVNLGA